MGIFFFSTDDFFIMRECASCYGSRVSTALGQRVSQSNHTLQNEEMSLLFISALKQTLPGLLLSVLEEIYAFLKPSCLHSMPPPPMVAAVSGSSRKEKRTQPESTWH